MCFFWLAMFFFVAVKPCLCFFGIGGWEAMFLFFWHWWLGSHVLVFLALVAGKPCSCFCALVAGKPYVPLPGMEGCWCNR